MTEAMEWQGRVGEVWAEEWRRTDRTLGPVADALIAKVEAATNARSAPTIVDIGCGAGSTSLMLADRIEGAHVVGIDLSPALVEVARTRAEGRPNIRFEQADASRWQPANGVRFDMILSRHGVMFFSDPVSAFANLHSLGTPDARLVFSCFRARAENPWVLALDPILARFAPAAANAPPPPVGPFAFGDPARVEPILEAAGFEAPHFQPLDFDMRVGVGEDPVEEAIAYFSRIGPFASMLRELDEDRRGAAKAQLREVVAAHLIDGEVRMRAAAWIVTARSAARP